MITTKKGDGGSTSLYDGTRVGKDDERIELNGLLDELNALLGLCKATAGQEEPYEQMQRELMVAMTLVGSGCHYDDRPTEAAEAQAVLECAVSRMEMYIKEVSEGRKFDFVLPGKSMLDAMLHLARTKARTCERRLVALVHADAAEGGDDHAGSVVPHHRMLMKYLNRLSDYLFCLCVQ